MSVYPARPWPAIVGHYQSAGPACQPLAQFVERITGSMYGQLLHAYTSMYTLLISVTDRFDPDHDALHVCMHSATELLFEYHEMPYGKPGWRRIYPIEQAWPAFARFVERRRWLTIDAAAASLPLA